MQANLISLVSITYFWVMPKEILLYDLIDSDSASQFVTDMEAAKTQSVLIRVNTDGGGPEDMFCMVAKFAEHPNKKMIHVDGKAYSGGCFLTAYADDAEALDVSEFLIHRASYGDFFEKNYMTPEIAGNLSRINASLRAAFESKVKAEDFERITGTPLDDVFSSETRIDVFFTAQQALEMGLINRIIAITPEKKAQIRTMMMSSKAARHEAARKEAIKIPNKNTMTLDELKAQHPAVYAQAVAEGVVKEKDRVESIMAFVDIDSETVKTAIAAGSPLTQKQMSELAIKQVSKILLKQAAKENADDVKTDEQPEPDGSDTAEKKAKKKAMAKFDAELEAELGITKK